MRLNTVILGGHLGRDPERHGSIVKFSLATNDGYTNKQGERVDKTNWHSITAFGKQADVLEKYCKQGDALIVQGSIEYREYEGKWYTDILLKSFSFAGAPRTESAPRTTQPEPIKPEEPKDDLPF